MVEQVTAAASGPNQTEHDLVLGGLRPGRSDIAVAAQAPVAMATAPCTDVSTNSRRVVFIVRGLLVLCEASSAASFASSTSTPSPGPVGTWRDIRGNVQRLAQDVPREKLRTVQSGRLIESVGGKQPREAARDTSGSVSPLPSQKRPASCDQFDLPPGGRQSATA